MRQQALVGVVGAGGLIVQIIIGFAVAGGSSAYNYLLPLHLVIGITGLALVAYLASRAFNASSNGVKVLYVIAFILVLAQVALGFRILAVPDQQLTMSHEGNAIAILVVIGLAEMVSGRQSRRQAAAESSSTAVAPVAPKA